MESVLREKKSYGWEGFVQQVAFKPAVKGVTDDESGESTQEDDVTETISLWTQVYVIIVSSN